MKKLAIVILCLLVIFIGFLLYKKVDQGIDAYNYETMNEVDLTQAKTLPVDEKDVFESYTHQVTTYPLFDEDVLQSTIHYTNNYDTKGIMICYIDGNEFIINSFEDISTVDKKVKGITGAYVVIWPEKYTLKSAIEGKLYEKDDSYFMLVHPTKVESVWFDFDEFSLKLSIEDI